MTRDELLVRLGQVEFELFKLDRDPNTYAPFMREWLTEEREYLLAEIRRRFKPGESIGPKDGGQKPT